MDRRLRSAELDIVDRRCQNGLRGRSHRGVRYEEYQSKVAVMSTSLVLSVDTTPVASRVQTGVQPLVIASA
jgi:hypothetical protein